MWPFGVVTGEVNNAILSSVNGFCVKTHDYLCALSRQQRLFREIYGSTGTGNLSIGNDKRSVSGVINLIFVFYNNTSLYKTKVFLRLSNDQFCL